MNLLLQWYNGKVSTSELVSKWNRHCPPTVLDAIISFYMGVFIATKITLCTNMFASLGVEALKGFPALSCD